jgi:hypothetical protein
MAIFVVVETGTVIVVVAVKMVVTGDGGRAVGGIVSSAALAYPP